MSRHLPARQRLLLLTLSECPRIHDRTRAPLAVARAPLAAGWRLRLTYGVAYDGMHDDVLCAHCLHAHVHRLLSRVSALSMRGTGHADAARLLQ